MKLQAFLPLITYPDAHSDGTVVNAVAIASQLNADLHAVALIADIPDVSSAFSRILLDVPEMIRNAETQSRKQGKCLLEAAMKEAQRHGVMITTDPVSAGLAVLGELAADYARYYDIALLGYDASKETSRMVAEALIFGAARPVILFPEAGAVGKIDKVAIAWDGSRSAARAVADAAPLLLQAAAVTVLTVIDEKPLKEMDAGERMASLLRKRGLNARALSIKSADLPIGMTLQNSAIEAKAGLLVMGGYAHSRLRDFVLGGATASVLDELRLPVLFSH